MGGKGGGKELGEKNVTKWKGSLCIEVVKNFDQRKEISFIHEGKQCVKKVRILGRQNWKVRRETR